jgi:hypothetical protein
LLSSFLSYYTYTGFNHSANDKYKCGQKETPEYLILSCTRLKVARDRVKTEMRGIKLGLSTLLEVSRGMCHMYVIQKRWKGFFGVMFWGSFTYDKKWFGHVWEKEATQEKRERIEDLDTRNSLIEKANKQNWEKE